MTTTKKNKTKAAKAHANTATKDEVAKTPAEPKAKKAKTIKASGEQKPKRVSALDAASLVLAKADKPMRAQDLIAAMAEQGIWTSPAGKTPSSTLYSALLREINAKGKDARFAKADRGLFAHNG